MIKKTKNLKKKRRGVKQIKRFKKNKKFVKNSRKIKLINFYKSSDFHAANMPYNVLAPCAVCDLRRRVFSVKRKYD